MNLFCFIKMKAREKGELLRQWTGPIRHSLSQRYLRLVWKNPRKLKKSSSANFSFQSSRNSFLYFSFLQNVLFSIVVKLNFGFGLTRISTRKIESSSLISVLNNFKDFKIETNFLNRNFNFVDKIRILRAVIFFLLFLPTKLAEIFLQGSPAWRFSSFESLKESDQLWSGLFFYFLRNF